MRIAARTGMTFVAACPDGYRPDEAIVASCARGRGRERRRDRGRHGPSRGGRRRARPLHRRLDEHGPGGGARAAAARPRALPDRRRAKLALADPEPSRSTACPPTSATRSRRTCSTATARSSGTRPRTACTSTRRCSRSRCAECGSTTSSGRRSTAFPPTSRPACATSRSSSRTRTAEDPDLYGLFDGDPADGGRPPARRAAEPDLDLPAAARGRLRRRRRAARGDPRHRAPRARPLLRARRGPPRGARLRVTTFLRDRDLGRVRRRRGRRRALPLRAPPLIDCMQRGMSG